MAADVKRAYHKPTLKRLGLLRDLTRQAFSFGLFPGDPGGQL